MKRSPLIALLVSITMTSSALAFPDKNDEISVDVIPFEEIFNDSTLRIDYIFGGGPEGPRIYLDSQTKFNGWAGRKNRLEKTPYAGNGSIIVTNPQTGDTLYLNTFSSLFQEWLALPEASENSKSFENSFIVPLPKDEADITLALRDTRNKEIVRLTHRYRPDDELIRNVIGASLPHKYLHKGDDPERAIDIAMLAEGYRPEEMDSFLVKAKAIADEILSYSPFSTNKERFNFVAVMTPSEESGVSIPLKGEWRNTAFGSHYSTFYSARYLTVPRVKKLHQSLEGIPYEHIIVVVNTTEYGGGGIYNSYQVAAADNRLTPQVAVHEFGHSFGGLADEYFYETNDDQTYPLDTEPWEPNITTLIDFDSKWKDKNIGMFEGGGYKPNGIYRPFETCRMRDNDNPAFCAVCEEALQKLIVFYTE